jgi:hypothetical protein
MGAAGWYLKWERLGGIYNQGSEYSRIIAARGAYQRLAGIEDVNGLLGSVWLTVDVERWLKKLQVVANSVQGCSSNGLSSVPRLLVCLCCVSDASEPRTRPPPRYNWGCEPYFLPKVTPRPMFRKRNGSSGHSVQRLSQSKGTGMACLGGKGQPPPPGTWACLNSHNFFLN